MLARLLHRRYLLKHDLFEFLVESCRLTKLDRGAVVGVEEARTQLGGGLRVVCRVYVRWVRHELVHGHVICRLSNAERLLSALARRA